MFYRLLNAGSIINFDGAGGFSFRSDIDEDQRNVLQGEAIKERLLDAECHYGYAIDLSLKHAVNADLHSTAVIGGGSDENFIICIDRLFFKALDELWEEGICDVRDDDSDKAATTGDQSSRLGVG